MAPTFKLQFAPSQIKALAARFTYADESDAFEAGKRIASGAYTLANLATIVEWKSHRSKGRTAKNAEADVADALHLAVTAKTDRAAIAVLLGLRGVQVPIASAILTSIAPERFTIIDYRALESLGAPQSALTVDFYLAYLAECRVLASTHGVSLRNLHRALWQWSSERGAV